jgi:hypothetical protein
MQNIPLLVLRNHTNSNLKYSEEMLKSKFVGHKYSSEKLKIVCLGKSLIPPKLLEIDA